MEYIQLGQKFLELFDELTACVVVPSVDRIRSIGFIGRTFRNAEKFLLSDFVLNFLHALIKELLIELMQSNTVAFNRVVPAA